MLPYRSAASSSIIQHRPTSTHLPAINHGFPSPGPGRPRPWPANIGFRVDHVLQQCGQGRQICQGDVTFLPKQGRDRLRVTRLMVEDQLGGILEEHVCMYVCINACIYVLMYACMQVGTYLCMCECMYICTYTPGLHTNCENGLGKSHFENGLGTVFYSGCPVSPGEGLGKTCGV